MISVMGLLWLLLSLQWVGWAGVGKKPVIQLMRFPCNFSVRRFWVRRRLQYDAVIVSFRSKSFRNQDQPLFSLRRLVILSVQRSVEYLCHYKWIFKIQVYSLMLSLLSQRLFQTFGKHVPKSTASQTAQETSLQVDFAFLPVPVCQC